MSRQAVKPKVKPAILINEKPICLTMFLKATLKKLFSIKYMFQVIS
jgi:hypothetical protein